MCDYSNYIELVSRRVIGSYFELVNQLTKKSIKLFKELLKA